MSEADTKRKRLMLLQMQAKAAQSAQPTPQDESPDAAPQQRGVISDVASQFGRGVVGGAASLFDTAVTRGAGMPDSEFSGDLSQKPAITGVSQPASPAVTASQDITGVQPDTTAGKFARTAGEFVPAAALPLGGAVSTLSNIVKYGIGSGLLSEGAGQLTEGTKYEDAARIAAAVAGPAILSGAVKPKTFKTGDTELQKQATYLASKGVQPTAGQATGSELLRRVEGATTPSGKQIESFTKAAMKSIGSTAPRATDDALRAAEKSIVNSMDDAVKGVSVSPTAASATMVDDIATSYVSRVPNGQLVPRVRGIADEIMDVATASNQTPIGLSKLKTWRSDIGKMTTSPDGATREAAHALRKVIDSLTDQALVAAGRESDIAALNASRTQYRNFLAVKDVASRSGKEVAKGLVSPARLQSAVARTQGRSNYALGKGTELGQLARAGEGVLASSPTVAAGAARNIPQLTSAGLGGAGLYMSGGNIPVALAAMSAPYVGSGLLKSGPVQRALTNPLQEALNAARGGTRVSGGLLAGEDQ